MEKTENKESKVAAAETQGESVAPQKELRNLDFLLDVPLQLSVEVGRSKLLIKDLLQVREGSVIELDKLAGEPLDVYVNSRLIARGEAVMVNDKFGLRLTDVVSPAERIEKLG
ncbi:MAG: flagellar motor switch protein FliN [Desulfuromonadales bacterium]|uniref:flagellar motor switch protein FliN n=1 Tax=Desulfuromonas sp. KJ2020 TaxID=2919173 RepID=UPI0020A7F7AF|nr:flagellar motor switch protein FliN [Desulfuromonas sp. KJ2020]MCP3178403.1 flagellar motor switch protein FliN [Desulfuromonas sp. KJ2020]